MSNFAKGRFKLVNLLIMLKIKDVEVLHSVFIAYARVLASTPCLAISHL